MLPYREVIADGLDSVMTTHTTFLALDNDHPATLSPTIIKRLLREELGYDGLVTTDCMEMKAIADHYGAGESAIMALLGDVDIVLFSHTREMQETALDAVTRAVERGRIPLARIESANERRARLLERVAMDEIYTTQVNSTARQESMIEIAAQGLSLLRGLTPEMDFDERVAFIEFASSLESEVMEAGGHTGIRTLLDDMDMHPAYVALKPYGEDALVDEAIAAAKRAKITIIATRNAYLLPEQAERARQIADAAHTVVHVCLRNPYDGDVLNAETVLASCGDSKPQVAAVLRALRGDVTVQDGLRLAEK